MTTDGTRGEDKEPVARGERQAPVDDTHTKESRSTNEPGQTPHDDLPATETADTPEVPGRPAVGEPVVVARKKGMFGSSLGNDTSGYGGLERPVLFPGEAPRPYGGYFDEVVDALAASVGAAFDAAVTRVVVDRGELTLHVAREQLPLVARALRDEPALRFEMCTGVSGVHYPEQSGAELHAVYHFLSITHGSRRIRVETTCPDADPHIPSLVQVYPSVDWHERETFDMFGIVFDGHPALTRILMPDDWPGHPQRKDYPLGGIPVEYKGATIPPPDKRRSYS
ncbi:MAG TPA: NADH-quinone oxidoreductase subunit C [Ornithinicoccus sp.]|jgi:NADH-quinone oxidoreductase subunit C|nr:NADH-quinone oxidoreductase subunit C [Ornithinicoccus sp.]